MPYAIKFPSSNETPKIGDFPPVPSWLVRRISKNKRVSLNYNCTNATWSINGKTVTRFDKKLIATAIQHAIKAQQGE